MLRRRFTILLFTMAIGGVVLAQKSHLQPQAIDYSGIYALQSADPSLYGRSVRVAAVCRSLTYLAGQPQDDFLLNTVHPCFIGRDILLPDIASAALDASYHSTSVGAILVGLDPSASGPDSSRFLYQGAMPDARLEVHEFWRFIRDYIYTGKNLDADLLTLSAGIPYEDWWTRGFDRLAERLGLVIVASAGNGSSVFDPVLYPAAGSNVIAVGVLSSTIQSDFAIDFGLPDSATSSSGPTADLRCKPDLVAPGNCLVPDPYSANGYRFTGDAASYSTPIVAGTVGLLIQKARSMADLSDPMEGPAANCVIKAILLSSARKLAWWHKGSAESGDDGIAPLDYLQGAGSLDSVAAHDLLVAGRFPPGSVPAAGWDKSQIANAVGSAVIYRFPVEPGKRISATLAWNRHYQSQYPYRPLPSANTDLRLELWAVDSDDPVRDYRIEVSDSPNDNVETIFAAADPNFAVYELRVIPGEKSVFDLTPPVTVEHFALAWRTVDAAEWLEQPLWRDLNGDGIVDSIDMLASNVLIRYPDILDNESFRRNILRISDERLLLLNTLRDIWSLAFASRNR